MLCAAEGGLKGAHAEEWVSLGALGAISLALEVRGRERGTRLDRLFCSLGIVAVGGCLSSLCVWS